jgi:hypothetical protein
MPANSTVHGIECLLFSTLILHTKRLGLQRERALRYTGPLCVWEALGGTATARIDPFQDRLEKDLLPGAVASQLVGWAQGHIERPGQERGSQ